MGKSPFPYSDDNKRYHTWNYHTRKVFGCKTGKISLDGGFTCPNIDGAKGKGGCIYCSPRGSGDFAGNPEQSIRNQYMERYEQIQLKWPQALGIAYFQAHSGTYAPIPELQKKYEEALSCPHAAGLCIATRADLISDELTGYLRELNSRTWLLLELGLQTIHDTTARKLNRCHTWQDFLQGYQKLADAGIRVCVHIINFLPGEDWEMMMGTARTVGALHPHSVKIHMLHVLKGTALADLYQAGGWTPPSMEQYIELVCDQLEVIPPDVVIQRLTGDADSNALLAPEWTTLKRQVLNGIDQELAARDSWQGKELQSKSGI